MRATTLFPCLLTLAAAMATTPAYTQEIEGDVPLDLVKALLANNNPQGVRLFTGIPENFPEFSLPASVELLGGADMMHSQQLVLRAPGDGMQQRTQIITELENQGYLLLTPTPGANPNQTGFIAPRQFPPNMPVQLCHDSLGMLNIRISGPGGMPVMGSGPRISPPGAVVTPFFSATPGVVGSPAAATPSHSIINLSTTGGPGNPRVSMMGGVNCEQMQLQFSGRGQSGPATMNLNLYMPRMELPPSATVPGPGMPQGFVSGSQSGMESRLDIGLDWSLGDVFRHFADQIDQQDWQSDQHSIGNVSATGSWTRQVDEQRFLGSLRVVRTSDDQYQLVFSIQALPAPQ